MCKKLICLISFLGMLTGAADADLVGLWRLDETSGTIAHDVSGNGHDGTLIGDPKWAPGKIGGALDFDGEEDLVELGAFDVIGSGITLAGWIRPESFAINDGRIITKANEWGENDHWWMLSTISDGGEIRLRFRLKTEGQSTTTLIAGSGPLVTDEWQHATATWDGSTMRLYLNGEEVGNVANTGTAVATNPDVSASIGSQPSDAFAPATPDHVEKYFDGLIDDVRLYNEALTAERLEGIMEGEGYPFASSPDPADGTFHEDTWVTLSWSPGDFAESHDVYLGNELSDVNEATRDSDLFRGNQDLTFYVAGFPGYAYPDGLVPGTTYYWRIDEVNESEPNSPWKGNIWSFTVPPNSAYLPDPADGAEFVPLNATLTWTAGFGAKLHNVYFGEDFGTVNEADNGVPVGVASYSPDQLKLAKTYYWRVDEFDGAATHKGDVWSFTTEGAVSGPNPSNGAVDVSPTQILTWDAGAVAASHEVYFGTDADAVKNSTKASPEYKGPKTLGEESYDPGKLLLETTYYWRIDEVNDTNPDSPWAGNVWSFTTGDFFVIDDFEDYDAGENQIWYAWHDGLGYGTPGTADYFAGNGTGAAVGDETTASYIEETIVHGGGQSMPLVYDNNKQGYACYSEVEHTLTNQRDWSDQGVTELSLWFRGNPASVGSFTEAPAGTYTMTGSGADIWNDADEFHFAYKMLTGVGSIEAQVLSVDNTDPWAKAGVMFRETLEPGSKFAAIYITPGNGCRLQARLDADINATSDTSVVTSEQTAITAPYWIKLERDFAGNFRGYYSSNGSTWQAMSWNPQNIMMSSNIYIGLAVTSHNAAATCEAKFSNVTITGTAGPQWAHQDIGIASNDAEPLYVAVSNSAGTPAVVVHDDPAAATTDTWNEWVIPLQTFSDQGINLTNVDKFAIGLGTQGNMTTHGGSGKMFIDNIRLCRATEITE
ncbi:MAG TPA: hypothetical protein DIU00_02160 [Phycisphaerales bacterium]|nr:hypothetical protein [Phycisphaerales bacterium]